MELPISQLSACPANLELRAGQDNVKQNAALLENIKEKGFLPEYRLIVEKVNGTMYQVISGERRRQALSTLLSLDFATWSKARVPCIVETYDNDQQRKAAILRYNPREEGLAGKSLLPWDTIFAFALANRDAKRLAAASAQAQDVAA